MSAAIFSKNNDNEGTACLDLYPGPISDFEEDKLGISKIELHCTHTQEEGKVEVITPLGRFVEGTACLFPDSHSESSSVLFTDDNRKASRSDSALSCSTSPRNQQETTKMSSDYAPASPKPSTTAQSDGLKVKLPPSPEASMCNLDKIDIREVPAKALNVPTRTRLSLMMNPPKVRRNDWTGLASEMGFEYEMIENISLERDPMKTVLAEWTCKQESTIGALLDMLEDLGRDDVLNDITKLVERDSRRWLERRKGDAYGQPIQVAEVSGSYPHIPKTQELRGITLEDHPSGPPEIFDAYVCFTDIDSDFVKEMISVLEKKPYNLKLCVDFRDLVPGGSYSTITAELIENRCKRMIIVLSPDFLASEQCDFQTKFAHSIAPSARNKRLIPVMVEPCSLPSILRHITICDYTKKDLRRWFWPRLHSSLSNS